MAQPSAVFGAAYSGAYDSIYQDKDYNAECDLIERLFTQYGTQKIAHVLDLGCGTGNHSVTLARRGYQVMGVDFSEEMLAAAWVKTGSLPPLSEIDFYHGDVRTVRLNQLFDAAIMMFGVMGYQVENVDVSSALATVRAHLVTGGLFLFDVWYGPAVLAIRPEARVKELIVGNQRLIRAASGELDTFRQVCRVDYRMWRMEDNRLVGETQETHYKRYFFAQELRYFLEKAGLELMNLSGFPNFEHQPDETTWNVLGVAKAV